jgi:hypothetical protein
MASTKGCSLPCSERSTDFIKSSASLGPSRFGSAKRPKAREAFPRLWDRVALIENQWVTLHLETRRGRPAPTVPIWERLFASLFFLLLPFRTRMSTCVR